MTSSRSFRTILLALTAGALGAIGCVITVGEVDCSECNADVDPDPLCHSEFNPATGMCECDPNYVFESNNPNDFRCERVDTKPPTGDCGSDSHNITDGSGQCTCEPGWVFCNDDPNDYSCCSTGDTDPDPTTSTTVDPSETTGDTETGTDTQADTGSGGETGPAELPPCDATLEGQTACTNNGGIDGVEDGEAYFCQDGVWNEVDMDAECVLVGQDFAYGCYFNDSDQVEYFCAAGPGTDCTDADDTCSTDTLLQSCLFGKLTDVDCEAFCTGKQAKIQTDFGTCDAETFTCCCFDEGDEGNCQ